MLFKRSSAVFERLFNLGISVGPKQLDCFTSRRINRRNGHLGFYTQTARDENAIEKVKRELYQ